MPSQVNILVFVHGMTPDIAPSDPRKPGATYDKFWQALQAHQPELTGLFPDGPILVEWGHQLSLAEDPVREDHKLTEVERFVNEQVSYRNLKQHAGPNNVLTSDWGIHFLRRFSPSAGRPLSPRSSRGRCDAPFRVFDGAGNVIDAHEHAGEFKEA